ncbi:MAG TPA: hypothetical protein VMW27_24835 [Thermoanaerobaculia bacterium]|nr:hypothetical protein [Thermoanaerobaculia bacterium]
MLALQLPILVLLLVPIIALEAVILSKVLQLSGRVALWLAALANLASTLVGIPVTWGALFGVELFASGATAYGVSTQAGRFHSAVLQAPWLIPYETELYWLVPVANLVLLPFYFLVSVYVEQWVVRRSRDGLDPRRAKRAAWLANAASYALLLLGSVVWLVRSVGGRWPRF